MGIGVSVILLAVGAILAFAIEAESSGGLNLNTVGFILMGAGAIGILAFLTVFGSMGGRGRTDVVVEERRSV
ncbi:MAG TPA: hypothetical protein VFU93_15915 [Acidimicrobiales bacterium]|nr:hypothetical protein [Acidimicrobiales bacterium]